MRISCLAVAVLVGACGTSSSVPGASSSSSGSSGENDPDASIPNGPNDGGPTSQRDGAAPPPPPPPAGWSSGPVTCSGTAAFASNYNGACGTERWSVKTGTDSAAGSISLVPTVTTSGALGQIPPPSFFPASSRVKPTETTAFALRDARLTFARLETDGDYHLVLADANGATIIGEIPYPGGCTTGSAWQCLLTRARASVDAQMTLTSLKGVSRNDVVSVVGVGFFDNEHGQYGAAPNAIELHPILSICFGAGCDPIKN